MRGGERTAHGHVCATMRGCVHGYPPGGAHELHSAPDGVEVVAFDVVRRTPLGLKGGHEVGKVSVQNLAASVEDSPCHNELVDDMRIRETVKRKCREEEESRCGTRGTRGAPSGLRRSTCVCLPLRPG